MFERVLVNHGDQKTVMTIGKPGILWKLDRVTGKFMGAKETIFQNVFDKIDPKTGAVTYRKDILEARRPSNGSPLVPGRRAAMTGRPPAIIQPDDLLIIPLSQSCVMIQGHDVEMKLGGGGTAASQKFFFTCRAPSSNWASWRPIAPRHEGDVDLAADARPSCRRAVHGGRRGLCRRFRPPLQAIDAKTGKILWQTRLGNTVQGYPVTFSLDGKQYIAVASGLGGGSPVGKPTTLLPNVRHPNNGNAIYVFALPDN